MIKYLTLIFSKKISNRISNFLQKGWSLRSNHRSYSNYIFTNISSHSFDILIWGGRIRTYEWRDQSPMPYHLATPQNQQINFI